MWWGGLVIGDGGAGYLVISNLLQGMSGTLNHSPSMDLTDLRRSEGLGSRLEGPGGPHSVLQPAAGGQHQQHSPLQHFVQVWQPSVLNRINLIDLQAKKKINEIFVEVEGYVSEAERFLASVPRYLGRI